MLALLPNKCQAEENLKAKIVDIAELKKNPQERVAEQYLSKLTNNNAIEVTLTGKDTIRKVARIYRKMAKVVGKNIRVRASEGRAFITLRPE